MIIFSSVSEIIKKSITKRKELETVLSTHFSNWLSLKKGVVSHEDLFQNGICVSHTTTGCNCSHGLMWLELRTSVSVVSGWIKQYVLST